MLDGTGRNSPNLTYSFVVETTPRLEYITWKDVLKEERKKSRIKTGTLVQFYYSTKPYDTNYLSYSENRFSNLTCVLQS